MAVAALRGPPYPSGENDTAERHVSRNHPPSGCGARSSCSARAGRTVISHSPKRRRLHSASILHPQLSGSFSLVPTARQMRLPLPQPPRRRRGCRRRWPGRSCTSGGSTLPRCRFAGRADGPGEAEPGAGWASANGYFASFLDYRRRDLRGGDNRSLGESAATVGRLPRTAIPVGVVGGSCEADDCGFEFHGWPVEAGSQMSPGGRRA